MDKIKTHVSSNASVSQNFSVYEKIMKNTAGNRWCATLWCKWNAICMVASWDRATNI